MLLLLLPPHFFSGAIAPISNPTNFTPPPFLREEQGPGRCRRGRKWHGLPFHGCQDGVQRGLKDLINVGSQGEELLEAREKGEFQAWKVRGAGMVWAQERQCTELKLIHLLAVYLTL